MDAVAVANMKRKKYQEGQILLVVVLLLAAALTMVMTISFTSRTENQVSKLQQDADKSLVAAEAGIEAAIKSNTGGTFSSLNLNTLQDSGIDTTNSSVSIQNTQAGKFVSPVVTKDDQYTLYLATYDNNGNFGNAPLSSISVYYGDNIACGNLAIELTVVTFDNTKPSDPTIQRFVADTSGKILGGSQIGSDLTKLTPPYYTILGTNFNCKTSPISLTPGSGASSKLLFVRVIGAGASTKIGIDDSQLPVQGRYFISTAKSTSGVTKKLKLFQSYPQIPAEFFVTSF